MLDNDCKKSYNFNLWRQDFSCEENIIWLVYNSKQTLKLWISCCLCQYKVLLKTNLLSCISFQYIISWFVLNKNTFFLLDCITNWSAHFTVLSSCFIWQEFKSSVCEDTLDWRSDIWEHSLVTSSCLVCNKVSARKLISFYKIYIGSLPQ